MVLERGMVLGAVIAPLDAVMGQDGKAVHNLSWCRKC